MTSSRIRLSFRVLTSLAFAGGLAGVAPLTAQAQWETAFVSVEKSRGYPVRGQTRDQVRQRHGEPGDARSPVGEPPISLWIYPGFTVYFEHDLVITSVAAEDTLPVELGQIQ